MSHHNDGISRRKFVQAGLLGGGAVVGAAVAGPAAWAADTSGELPRRVLGKTGVRVTALTLGTAPSGFTKPSLPQRVADIVNAAIDLGINAIDTAPLYAVAEEGVGLALGKRRKEVFLSTKVWADTVADAEKSFSNSLRKLKTDHVDLVYFHQLGDRKVEGARDAEGVYTWLLKQKQAGKTRFVGFSIHNRPGRGPKFLSLGEVDVLLTVLNFVDRHSYNFEGDVLPAARRANVGIVAMKVFGGALKMDYADPAELPRLDLKHLELSVRYTLGIPGVATLNIGVHTVEQLKKNVAMVKRYQPLSPEEQTACAELGKKLTVEWGLRYGPLARGQQPLPGAGVSVVYSSRSA